MKKCLSVVLCVLLMLPILAVFQAASSEGAEAPAEKAVIRFLFQTLDETQAKAWDDFVLNPFHEKYPNIQINMDNVANHWDVAKVQMASGEGPDFFEPFPSELFHFYNAGLIADLTPYYS